MPTKDEIDQAALDTAEGEYLGQIVDSYAKNLSPKIIDKVLRVVAQKNEGVEGVERRLAGATIARKVAQAQDAAATPEIDKMMAEVDRRFDSIMTDFGPRQPEPELEPEPFGKRTVVEGEDFRLVQEKFGSGEIDTATYEKARADAGLEPMRA